MKLPIRLFPTALKTSLFVGTLLTLINQGEGLAAASIDAKKGLRIALCYAVPFLVSLYSQVVMFRRMEFFFHKLYSNVTVDITKGEKP